MILVSPNNPIFDGLHVWFGKDLVPDAALLIYQVRVVTLEVRWLVVSLNTSRTSSIWTHIPKVTGALILDQLGKQQAPYHCGKQFSKGGLWRQTVTEFNCTFYSWQVFVVKLAFTMQTSGTCGNNLLCLRRRDLVQDPLCEQFHNVTVRNLRQPFASHLGSTSALWLASCCQLVSRSVWVGLSWPTFTASNFNVQQLLANVQGMHVFSYDLVMDLSLGLYELDP